MINILFHPVVIYHPLITIFARHYFICRCFNVPIWLFIIVLFRTRQDEGTKLNKCYSFFGSILFLLEFTLKVKWRKKYNFKILLDIYHPGIRKKNKTFEMKMEKHHTIKILLSVGTFFYSSLEEKIFWNKLSLFSKRERT